MASTKKRTSKAGVILSIISLLLVITLIGYIVTAQFKGWDVREWIKKSEAETEQPVNKGEMVIELDPVKSTAPIAIVPGAASSAVQSTAAVTSVEEGQSADEPARTLAGKSVTLSCRVVPDNATIQTGTWGAAWSDSSAEWAQGKNVLDYVQITPQSEGSLTATVTCLQAFGAQISIIVTSDDKEDGTISATCKAQYAARVTDGSLQLYRYFYESVSDESSPSEKTVEKTVQSTSEAFDFAYSDNWSTSALFSYDTMYDQSRFVFKYVTGIGTKPDLPTDYTGSGDSLISTSRENYGGSTSNTQSMKLALTVADGVKEAVSSALGGASFGRYEMDGASIIVSEAFRTIFGDNMNTPGKLYTILQQYYAQGTPAFQFELTFTGISGTEYNFKYGVKINVADLRTAAREFDGIPPEITF